MEPNFWPNFAKISNNLAEMGQIEDVLYVWPLIALRKA